MPTMTRFHSMGVALAVVALLAVAMPAQADFCWRDSYGRGVGKIPDACGAGKQNDAGLCYPTCNAGYYGVGPVCWQNCVSGYTDFGVGCSKPAPYGRGVGYPWKFGDALNDSGMYSRCEADNGGAGKCEKNGLIIYPKCKAGFHPVGCCVCSPDCPAGLIDSGATCTKNTYGRGVGTIPNCAAGLQYDAGLCYTPCKASYAGVGPVCWGSCPSSSPISCGAGCASSDNECSQAITDQVTSVLEMVESVAETAATGGASAGIKAGVKTSIKSFASKLSKDQVKKKVKEMAKDVGQTIAEAQVDNLANAAAGEDFDVTTLDPTGIGSIVKAYNHKVCAAPAAGTPAPSSSGPHWEQVVGPPGATPKQVSVGNANAIWVLDTIGRTWQWSSAGWVQKSCCVSNIAVSSDGAVWATNPPDSMRVLKWDNAGSKWAWNFPTGMKQVTAVNASTAWGLSDDGSLHQWDGSAWVKKGCCTAQISVGADGQLWATNPPDSKRVLRWDGSKWTWNIPTGMEYVSVGNASNIWALDASDQVYKWNSSSWQKMPGGLKNISAASDGSVWGVNAQGTLYKWVTQ